MQLPSLIFFFFCPLLLLLLLLFNSSIHAQNDTQALLAFRAESDPHTQSLAAWNTSDCCKWSGVTCTRRGGGGGGGGRVTRLSLRARNLTGSLHPLLLLTDLRVLILSNNNFQGPLLPAPPSSSNSTDNTNISSIATNWKHLWFLALPSNRFSGPIPDSISSLYQLRTLDLSHNNFSGTIPPSLVTLTMLLSLHLHHNNFTGTIPNLALPNLVDLSLGHNLFYGAIPALNMTNLTFFDVSYNNLSGLIPLSLARFPSSSFYGNLNLCGTPLPSCNGSDVLSSPASPFVSIPSTHNDPFTLNSPQIGGGGKKKSSSSKLSLGAIAAIVVGDVILLLLLILLFSVYYQRSKVKTLGGNAFGDCKSNNFAQDIHCLPGPSSKGSIDGAESSEKKGKKKLVFFDDVDDSGDGGGRKIKKFELEDLLRASAEMLGKGSLGTAYKAVLEDGGSVAIKRLKEANASSKKEFEQQMDVIGKIRGHHNLVSLRAFYYAKDEKLLVYDFMPNGSLFNLLHGNRGPGRVPLDWSSRVRIALGAARGIAHLHNNKIEHGNIKSSNVLLNREGNACVSDFALAPLMPSSVTMLMASGYKAPELVDNKKVSLRTDMYSFGVLLLEILTGKSPAQSLQDEGLDLARWVQSVVREEWTAEVFDLELMHYKDNEQEMVSLLQIAMSCVSVAPQQRPKMRQVVRMIEGVLRGEQSPLRDCSNDEASSPPSIY